MQSINRLITFLVVISLCSGITKDERLNISIKFDSKSNLNIADRNSDLTEIDIARTTTTNGDYYISLESYKDDNKNIQVTHKLDLMENGVKTTFLLHYDKQYEYPIKINGKYYKLYKFFYFNKEVEKLVNESKIKEAIPNLDIYLPENNRDLYIFYSHLILRKSNSKKPCYSSNPNDCMDINISYKFEQQQYHIEGY